ncbi:hypothetical protein [Vibrio sp. WXL210]|uniref:hypothetical protein n=1 Tax=Vibrio sp. WXL210 TaxID=3450709 RepID=UPI003EC528D5
MKLLMSLLLIIFPSSSLASEVLFKFSCTDTKSENKRDHYGWDGGKPGFFPDSHGILDLVVSDDKIMVLINGESKYEALINSNNVKLSQGGRLELFDDNQLKFDIDMFAYDLEDWNYAIVYEFVEELTDQRIKWYCEERGQGKIYDNASAFFDFMINKLKLDKENGYEFIVQFWSVREQRNKN